MDESANRRGELVAGIGAMALFLFMFVDWYEATIRVRRDVPRGVVDGSAAVPTSSESESAWEAFSAIDVFLLLAILATIGVVLFRMSGTLTLSPVTIGVVAGAGAAALVLVAFRALVVPEPSVPDIQLASLRIEHDVSRQAGLFLGLLAAAAMAAGGFLLLRDRGAGSEVPAAEAQPGL